MTSLKNPDKGEFNPKVTRDQYNGKQIKCFISWNKKWGVTSKILREIFKTLDHYETLTCDTGTNLVLYLMDTPPALN